MRTVHLMQVLPSFIGPKVPINGPIRAAILVWPYMCFRLPASLKSPWQRLHSNKQWVMTVKGASSSSCFAPWLIIHDMRPTCTPLIFMSFLTITVVLSLGFHSWSDIKCLCEPLEKFHIRAQLVWFLLLMLIMQDYEQQNCPLNKLCVTVFNLVEWKWHVIL